jgi:hypothetical protein
MGDRSGGQTGCFHDAGRPDGGPENVVLAGYGARSLRRTLLAAAQTIRWEWETTNPGDDPYPEQIEHGDDPALEVARQCEAWARAIGERLGGSEAFYGPAES